MVVLHIVYHSVLHIANYLSTMAEPISSFSISTLVVHGVIAWFGAIVHAAQAHRKGQVKTFLDFCVLSLISSFSGAMFAFMGLYMFGETNLYLTMAIAGTGGYLGVEGMALIIERVKKIISGK